MHPLSVFYTKMEHSFHRALADDQWVISDKIKSSLTFFTSSLTSLELLSAQEESAIALFYFSNFQI